MVLYYTGTGNSGYAAKKIAKAINDKCENLFDRLKNMNTDPVYSDKPFVIVCPTYGWQIPHILRDWLEKKPLKGSRDIYFVMTCGSEIGNAAKYLRGLCEHMGMHLKGCGEIVMPENYIALFDAPDKAEALKIIQKADPVLENISKYIVNGENIPCKPVGTADRLKSGIVNTVFYSAVISAKKFRTTDACIGCGKCASVCISKNIKIVDGAPEWGDNCTHCMACICGCPVGAIEYGNASKGKPRYQCPKNI